MIRTISDLVSIVITSKNSDNTIRACLTSIKKQTHKNLEVILVDNSSTDNTVRIAKKYTSLIFNAGPERSAQRNLGFTYSKGRVVMFIDSDMVLSPKVVEESLMVMKNSKLKALIIPEISFGRGFWAECKALERSFYQNISWMEAARCYQRSVFIRLKGFDIHNTGTEDFDLSQRFISQYGVNSLGRISNSIAHNEGKLELWESLKTKFYYGKTMNSYFNKLDHTTYISQQVSLVKRFELFFSNPKAMFHSPIIFTGMLLFKTLEFTAIALGWLNGLLVIRNSKI